MEDIMFTYRAKLIKWVDGDTFDADIDLGFGVWVRNQRFRLYGVNTPEMKPYKSKHTFDGIYSEASRNAEIKAAKEALSLCEQLIPIDADCTVKTYKDKTGKFGRMLVEIYPLDEDKSVNSHLIENGMAEEYHGGSRD